MGSNLPGWKDVEMGAVILRPGSSESNITSTWRTFKPVIDYNKCTDCGLCWVFCPEPAIYKQGKRYYIDYDHCKGCGICYQECPLKAIMWVKEEER